MYIYVVSIKGTVMVHRVRGRITTKRIRLFILLHTLAIWGATRNEYTNL